MISSKKFAEYARDPSAFRADLLIDVNGTARRFGDVQDDWQRKDFSSLDAALMRCVGRSEDPAKMRAYLERARGHSKTCDLAVTCCWALAFATRPIRGYGYAADKDQARLLRDAVETIVRLNPWLSDILSIDSDKVTNHASGHPGEGSRLDISASDVASSFGILPDFVIADELCHWLGDGSLWHSIISSVAKRDNCLLVVISNAGFIDSWQWSARESARTDEAWYFSRLDGPVASWITPERLAEQRRMLPAVAFNRLWGNQWSTGAGDGLSHSDREAAFDETLGPTLKAEPGWLYCAGCDLGLTRDCASVVVLGAPAGGIAGRIRLARCKLWRPTPGRKIDLAAVETYILLMDEVFHLEQVAFDPWQAEHMAQRPEANTDHARRNASRRFGNEPWMRELPPVAANIRA